jgi:hypothetical protein
MSSQIHTYTELEHQIHEDLLAQHPEWVKPTGECPQCDEHEARLKKMLEALARSESGTEARPRVLGEDQTGLGSS